MIEARRDYVQGDKLNVGTRLQFLAAGGAIGLTAAFDAQQMLSPQSLRIAPPATHRPSTHPLFLQILPPRLPHANQLVVKSPQKLQWLRHRGHTRC